MVLHPIPACSMMVPARLPFQIIVGFGNPVEYVEQNDLHPFEGLLLTGVGDGLKRPFGAVDGKEQAFLQAYHGTFLL
jgi:hypothetical protein